MVQFEVKNDIEKKVGKEEELEEEKENKLAQLDE